MLHQTRHMLSACLLVLAGVSFAACGQSTAPFTPDATALSTANGAISPEARRQLAALRRFTASFHRFEAAQEAGWSVQLSPCLEVAEGGQGIHYANPAFIDGDAVLLEPELLMYEPRKNGRFRLVGVEYIVPFSEVPITADPPMLLGREFHANAAEGIWALHVWLWRHNPSGMFADWNPRVTCEFDGS